MLAAVTGASIAWAQQAAPAQSAEKTTASSGAESSPTSELQEVIVTGTSIRGVPPSGSSLISVTREDIKTNGAATTPDLLASVPQLNSFNTAPKASAGGFGSFAPGLRALPSSATLLLMNGHRLVGASAQETNPDYPNIPGLALERVEIVADGASATYGSDAIAGVVNFITRKHFSGAEASVRYGLADDYHASSASGLVGKDWGRGSVLAAYQYTQNNNITGGDRDFRVLDFRPFGGVDTRSINCPSANVALGTTLFAAPALAPNTTNFCDNGAVADLCPKSRIHSGFLSAQQQVGDRANLWADILYSDRLDKIGVTPPVQTLTITAANPFFAAPPGTGALFETVLFRMDNLFGADHLEQTDNTKIGNSSAGVDVLLPRDFNLSVYGTLDWATNVAFQPGINAVALAVAAAGTTPVTALDPFGQRTSPAVAAAITNNPTSVTIHQRTSLGAVKVDGPLFDLPGGQLKVAAGGEYRRETFNQQGFVGTTPVPEDLERNIYSFFSELFVPIVGEGNRATLLHSLSLSLSGRYDHYSDFGQTTNPKFGLNWDPIEGLTFHGTYGRSFRAPGMRQVGATVGSVYLPASFAAVLARDPTRGAAQVDTVYLIGGNNDLQPERARTHSFGVDWLPSFVPNLRASMNFYDIEFTDAIGTPGADLLFADPTFAPNIYRNPSAADLSRLLGIAVPINLPNPLPPIGNLLDRRLGNFGIRNTRGLDFDINYRRSMSFGTLFAGVTGNHVLEFDTQLSPASAATNSLRLGVPRLTFRTSLGLQAGPVGVASFVNYRDGVRNTFNTPTGTSSFKADAYTTVDLRVTWTLPNAGPTAGTELALQVNDLFDKNPPFFPATDGIGGDYNPIGRFIALNIRKAF
jgi:iron complex outermembrane receptor protein